MGSSQGLQERRRTEYMRGLSSIYQTDSIVDAATATATLMETEVISGIEVDDYTIEVRG